MAGSQGRGRPRSESSRLAVLEATRELVLAHGYEHLTIEAIAERAGVGRQTIYRWWRSKADILAEAVLEGIIVFGLDAKGSVGEGGELRARLAAWFRVLGDETDASLTRALVAAAAGDSTRADALYEYGTRALHGEFVAALEAGIANGTFRREIDPATTVDALIGAGLFRLLTHADIPDDYADVLLAPLLADQSRTGA